jgi:murein L,D-transpeptidase YafK
VNFRRGGIIFLTILGWAIALNASSLQPASIVSLPKIEKLPQEVVVVDKEKRQISVWQNHEDGLKKVYEQPMDMGKQKGDKHTLGDHRTPEGIYFFTEMYEGTYLNYEKYGLRAFNTTYPNIYDRLDKKTGSGIWLHAIPDLESLERGSRGCVVIRNQAILEISQYITLNHTPFVIHAQVDYQSPSAVLANSTTQQSHLEAWRASWAQKDIENYMSFYSDDFYSQRKNKNQWKTYKSFLANSYQEISVQLSEPSIIELDHEMIMKMYQSYSSDRMSDFGIKTLYWRRASADSPYQIIAEEWQAADDLLEPKIFTAESKPSDERIPASSSN